MLTFMPNNISSRAKSPAYVAMQRWLVPSPCSARRLPGSRFPAIRLLQGRDYVAEIATSGALQQIAA